MIELIYGLYGQTLLISVINTTCCQNLMLAARVE